MTGLKAFDTTVQRTNEWLADVQEELGWDDRHRAYLLLRSTLHALRDRLTVEEAVQLAAQLPMLIRGFYFDGWTLREENLRERHKEQFLGHVQKHITFESSQEAERAVRAIFTVLSRQVDEGEIEDVRNLLPAEVREFFPMAGTTPTS